MAPQHSSARQAHVALVTGDGFGIRASTAAALAGEGWSVVICGRCTELADDETAALAKDCGIDLTAFTAWRRQLCRFGVPPAPTKSLPSWPTCSLRRRPTSTRRFFRSTDGTQPWMSARWPSTHVSPSACSRLEPGSIESRWPTRELHDEHHQTRTTSGRRNKK